MYVRREGRCLFTTLQPIPHPNINYLSIYSALSEQRQDVRHHFLVCIEPKGAVRERLSTTQYFLALFRTLPIPT